MRGTATALAKEKEEIKTDRGGGGGMEKCPLHNYRGKGKPTEKNCPYCQRIWEVKGEG